MIKTAVEKSPHRKQIEEMIINGESGRTISDWLKQKGESISYVAINKYKTKFNPNKKAREKYHEKKSKERLDKATNEILSDLDFLDKVKDVASKVKVTVDDNTSPLDIVKVGIQAVRTKNEILKAGEDSDKDFTIKIIGVEGDGKGNSMETIPETKE